jgi:acyl-CoA synthetase (AMP-forming)/AMP-acid ligase II
MLVEQPDPKTAQQRSILWRRWKESGWHRGVNVIDAIHERKAQPGDVIRFVAPDHEREMTLEQLFSEGGRLASVLLEIGVQPGESIALHVPNWPEALVATYAAFLLRAVLVPIPAIYRPSEVRFILEDANVKTYVVGDRWRKHDYLADLSQITSDSGLERVIVIGEAPPGFLAWADIVERAVTAPLVPVDAYQVPADQAAILVYTSGSTANPKGAVHSHDTILAEFRQGRDSFGRPGWHLAAFPGGHLGGLMSVMRPLLFGGGTAVLDHWDAEVAAHLVDELGIASITGPPYYLATLLDAAERQGANLRSIEDFSTGGAGVPAALIERADQAGFHPYRTYGSTEHPTVATNAPNDNLHDRSQTDGVLLGGAEIRIVDESDHDLPVGSEGEIVTRGPDQFLGYTSPAANQASFTKDGWFRTGDLGSWTARGRLVVTGRKKDVISRGGEKLSALEIEDILARHPSVAEAAVIGAPDPLYGERACAFVVLKPGAALSIEDVRIHFAKASVARQKTPELLFIETELPRTAAGKVHKLRLRERLAERASRTT